LVVLAGVTFIIAGVIITAIASYSVMSIHWAWGVPFVFVGAICLVFGLVIPLQQ
jgi:uncharacterized membrane protein HdeD (DUF308 family)